MLVTSKCKVRSYGFERQTLSETQKLASFCQAERHNIKEFPPVIRNNTLDTLILRIFIFIFFSQLVVKYMEGAVLEYSNNFISIFVKKYII